MDISQFESIPLSAIDSNNNDIFNNSNENNCNQLHSKPNETISSKIKNKIHVISTANQNLKKKLNNKLTELHLKLHNNKQKRQTTYHPKEYYNKERLLAIIAPSFAFFGCQFAWAVQDGNVSPYFRELGVNDAYINYAWILGPITGIIIQPFIGVFSDHCTSKYGRRRPFIIYGSIILCICLVIFSNALQIAQFLFSGSTAHWFSLILAFICFSQLDFSTNFMEGPLRALTCDTLSNHEQLQSNSWFGIMNGLASTLAFALGYFSGDIRLIFFVALIVVVIFTFLTCYFVIEEQYQPLNEKQMESNNSHSLIPMCDLEHDESDIELNSDESVAGQQQSISSSDASIGHPTNAHVLIRRNSNENEEGDHHHLCDVFLFRIREIMFGLQHMPRIVRQCWIAQFCTFFAHFANWVYLADFFGNTLMNGNPDGDVKSDEYQSYVKGVEYGNLVFMFISASSVVFCFFSPKLVNMFGVKPLWLASLIVYAIVMICTPLLSDPVSGLMLFAFIGLPMGASFTLPWSVIARYSHFCDKSRAGLWATLLNIAECVAEIAIGLSGGLIVHLFSNRVSAVLFFAGIINFVGAFVVYNIDLSEYDLSQRMETLNEIFHDCDIMQDFDITGDEKDNGFEKCIENDYETESSDSEELSIPNRSY